MKKHLLLLAFLMAGLTVVTARAQPGPPPGPNWDGAMAKLFGNNPDFTATMEFHMTRASGQEMTMPGKMAHLEGKARFEVDLSNMQGANMSPQAAARMKQMGMGKMYTITRRDLNTIYMVYPEMKAYTEMPTRETNAPVSDYKAEVTKVGEETVNGHNCIKNKVVVTCPDGSTRESTLWNATDLNNFPIKVELAPREGRTMVLLFNDVKLEKPDASLFDPPTDFTKYDNMMSLMMSRARGVPPH
jgi:hypothetical protein